MLKIQSIHLQKFLIKWLNFFIHSPGKSSLKIIGVGPGDPSLLTLAAVDAIKKSSVIFYPVSGENKESHAANIVKKYIKLKRKIPIIFPMARKEFDAQDIWRGAAKEIFWYLSNKHTVSLLCLGDTSIYASSYNIMKEFEHSYPQIDVKIIPGISSFSVAASLSNFQLIKNEETLEIFECPKDSKGLFKLLNNKNKKVLVIMKVGKKWKWVKKFLKKESLIKETVLAINLGMKNQFIGCASICKLDELPYFSLLMVRFN